MLKPFGTCKLCNSKRFLNYAGLCKSCNKKEEGSMIKRKAIEKQQLALEARKEMAKQQPVEPEEEPAAGEEGEETEGKEPEAKAKGREKKEEKESKE